MEIEKIKALAMSDSGFIFDPTSGHSYITNEIGLKILNELKADKDIPEIIEDIVDEYDINRDEAEVDFLDFLGNLKNFYLVTD